MGRNIDLHLLRLRCLVKHNIGLQCRKAKGHTDSSDLSQKAHESTCIVQWQRDDGEIRLMPGLIAEAVSS